MSWICRCGPATWRWLLKWGLTAVCPFIKVFAAERGPRQTWEATTRLLSFWSRARLPPPLPEAVLFEWLGRTKSSGVLDSFCHERVAIVAQHASGLSQAELRNQDSEIADVLEQAIKPAPFLDRNQKRAGWNWLKREQRDKVRRGPLMDGDTLADIRSRLPSVFSASGFDFLLLRNEQAFIEEGRLMDHCMDQTPTFYLNDGQLHFSIRCRASGQRIATCNLGIGSRHLAVAEVLGPENQFSPKSVKQATEMLARQHELFNAVARALNTSNEAEQVLLDWMPAHRTTDVLATDVFCATRAPGL